MQDEAIIDLYWKRDESAIYETAQKYDRYCKSIALNIVNNMADAEECVSDTYLGAWNSIPNARPSIFRVFLGKITRNLSLNKYDYNTAQKRNQNFTTLLSELEDCLPANNRVEQQAESNQTNQNINNFLLTLEDEARNIFILRYWHANSIADIAKKFDMSESKVKSLLFRVRNKLKSYLESEGTDL